MPLDQLDMNSEEGLAEAMKRMAEEDLGEFKSADEMTEDELLEECFLDECDEEEDDYYECKDEENDEEVEEKVIKDWIQNTVQFYNIKMLKEDDTDTEKYLYYNKILNTFKTFEKDINGILRWKFLEINPPSEGEN